jgi:hypothetical protein
MALETISTENAYCTKPNIVIPASEPRTAAAIADVAADHCADSLAYGDGPRSVSGGDDTNDHTPVGTLNPVTGEADTELFTDTTHGLTVGDALILASVTGGTGLTAGNTYYVLTTPDADTFTVSATRGGSTTAFSTDVSAGVFVKIADPRDEDDVVVTYGDQTKSAT